MVALEEQPTPRSRPMLMIALAHLAGVFSGGVLPLPTVLLLSIILALIIYSAMLLNRARRVHGPLPGMGLGLIFAVLCLGWWQGSTMTCNDHIAREQATRWDGREVQLAGTIVGLPSVSEKGIDLTLGDVTLGNAQSPEKNETLRGHVRCRIGTDALVSLASMDALISGTQLWLQGEWRAAGNQTAPSTFNVEAYLIGHEMTGWLGAYRAEDWDVIAKGEGIRVFFARALLRIRHDVDGVLARHLSGDHLNLARALVLGDASRLTPELRERYQASGLAHLLAISGLHTGMVMLLLMAVGRLWFSPRGCAWFVVIGLICFAVLSGGRPSVVRAALMLSLLQIGFALGRSHALLNTLATAAFITLVCMPRNLFRLDWQLSYLSVLGLLLLAPGFHRLMMGTECRIDPPDDKDAPHWRWTWWGALLDRFVCIPLAATLAVSLMLFPMLIANFERFFWLCPLTNLMAIPLTAVFLFSVILMVMLGWVPGLGWLLATLAGGMADGLAAIAETCSRWLWAVHTDGPMPLIFVGVYYGLLLGGGWLRATASETLSRTPRAERLVSLRMLIWVGAAVALGICYPIVAGRVRHAGLEVYCLDVGQGDSTVIRTPEGYTMVIDTGRPGRGKNVIAPFLRTLGVERIDWLVLTHRDLDHIGGAPYLIESFAVGMLIEGEDEGSHTHDTALEAALAHWNVPRQRAHLGERLRGTGALEVRWLGSVPGQLGNDASVVTWLRYGEIDLLFPGDLGLEGEKYLVLEQWVQDMEILMAGHHGSRHSTSSVWLDVVRPEAVLVSAGRGNSYGHPSRDLIERLDAARIPLWRTDLDGTLRLSSNGQEIEIFRYLGE